MQFNPYGGTAAQLAAALVNAGPGAGVGEFEHLLASYDYRPSNRVTPTEAVELRTWADRLRAVFTTSGLAERVRLVNNLLTSAAAPPHISQHDGREPHFHYASMDAPTADRLRAYTAAGLAHTVCEAPDRLGQCARVGCAVVYIDISRNGRRRFCSARCANRTHVAEHRRRSAPTPH